MRLMQVILFAHVIFLFGCWDSSKSPLAKNLSGKTVTLQLIFDERVENFIIENNDSLLLPNLVEDDGILKELSISSNDEASVVLTEKEIFEYLNERQEVFIIQEGLGIKTVSRR